MGGGTSGYQYQQQQYHPRPQPRTHPQQQRNYDRYTGGLSEEEQMAQAMRDSRQQCKLGELSLYTGRRGAVGDSGGVAIIMYGGGGATLDGLSQFNVRGGGVHGWA